MKDAFGRRYVEVKSFAPKYIKDLERLAPDKCADCGAVIRHGIDRYFQRNDPEDGTPEQQEQLGGSELAALLAELTYDAVCEICGHKALGHPKGDDEKPYEEWGEETEPHRN